MLIVSLVSSPGNQHTAARPKLPTHVPE